MTEQKRPVIAWTRPMLERFKKAYKDAPGDHHATFIFEGNEFVKGYAKYLIEYLEPLLAKE